VTKASRHHVVSRRADLTNRWWRIANNTRNRAARQRSTEILGSFTPRYGIRNLPHLFVPKAAGTVRLVISGCSTWPAACRIAPVRADSVERAQPMGPTDSSHSPTLRRVPDRQPVVACVDRCMIRPKGRSGRGPHLERDARQHFSRSRADYRRPPARTR
jgi:hypothetical protein